MFGDVLVVDDFDDVIYGVNFCWVVFIYSEGGCVWLGELFCEGVVLFGCVCVGLMLVGSVEVGLCVVVLVGIGFFVLLIGCGYLCFVIILLSMLLLFVVSGLFNFSGGSCGRFIFGSVILGSCVCI